MKARTKRQAGLHDSFQLRGYLEYVLRNAKTGEIVKRGKIKNVVTAAGRSYALKQIASATAPLIQAIALGRDSSATASNSSQLVSYDTIRTIGTSNFTTATNTPCTFQAAVSFQSNETWAGGTNPGIGEFALYNSNTTGGSAIMFNRVTTSALITFASTNTLAISISITN